MARLRHVHTGSTVVIPDEKAERLGSEWEPVEVEKKAAVKRSTTTTK